MDRRGFFGLFVGLPFVSFLKEKKKIKVRWVKDESDFVLGNGVHKESCNIGAFGCIVSQSGGMITATEGRYRKSDGKQMQSSFSGECTTITQAKQWCIDEVRRVSKGYLRMSKEVFAVLGED